MLDRAAVGRTTPPTLNEVERGAIRRFAEAIGDYNPIYFDAEYARASGFSNVAAPPSFPISFATGSDLRELVGVPSRNLLLGEVSFDFERPIIAGDRLLVVSRVAEISDRAGPAGRVEIAVIEDEGRDEDGQIVFRTRRSYVVRATRES
jgi:acyl dehydratase